jgi:hypothetical protein
MLEHSSHKEMDLPSLGLDKTLRRFRRKVWTWETSFLLDSCHQLHLRKEPHEHLPTALASMNVFNSSGIYGHHWLNPHQGAA